MKKKQGKYNFTKAKGKILQDGGSGNYAGCSWGVKDFSDRESASELLKIFEVNGTARTQKPHWRG